MLKEVVVVEGKNDTAAVQRAVAADTIETGGASLSPEVLRQIALAQERRGVIVLTDPDGVGEWLRRCIDAAVPGCKHAFLTREEASKNGDIGVEHASPAAIRNALLRARPVHWTPVEQISWETFVAWGLAGGAAAKQLRLRLGEKLGIGYGNAQQMYKKIQRFQITEREFLQAMAELTGQSGGAGHEASHRDAAADEGGAGGTKLYV
ncbi:MAG: ribonuclease M5 [Bacillota bacterium]|nr:ribonuclease M5 [Bacillota bacterium]